MWHVYCAANKFIFLSGLYVPLPPLETVRLDLPGCSHGYLASFPGVKQQRHEADHSSPPSADTKNE